MPFALRRRWRDIADSITEEQKRDITIEDVTEFVDKRARAANHPQFGNLAGSVSETRNRSTSSANERKRKPTFTSTNLSYATHGEKVHGILVKIARFGNVYCAPSNTGYRVVRPSEKRLRKKDSNLYEKRDCVTTVCRLVTWQNLALKKVSVKWRIAELEESTQPSCT